MRKRDVKAGAYLLAILALSFIAISIVADISNSLGVDLGEMAASIFGIKTIKHADVERCDCVYDPSFEDYMCNEYCGDMSGAFCEQKSDCII